MSINGELQDNWDLEIAPSKRQLYVSYLSTNELARAEERAINKLSTELSPAQRATLMGIIHDLRRELAGRQLGLF